jgi:hypothetical protein
MYNATYYTCLETYLCIKMYTNNKVLGDRYPCMRAKPDLTLWSIEQIAFQPLIVCCVVYYTFQIGGIYLDTQRHERKYENMKYHFSDRHFPHISDPQFRIQPVDRWYVCAVVCKYAISTVPWNDLQFWFGRFARVYWYLFQMILLSSQNVLFTHILNIRV